MHIRCPHCSTLYEFPTPQQNTATMSVRCSACQAVFNVELSGENSPTIPAIVEADGWHVLRPATGERRQVADFRALQRLIIDKGLEPDDLVSEDRTNWKRADSIDALGELFDLAARVPQSNNPTSTIGRVSRSVPTQRSPAIGQSESTATMPGIDDLIRRGVGRRTQMTPNVQDATGGHGGIRSTTPTIATNASQPLPQAHSTARSHAAQSPTSPTSAHVSPQVSQPLPPSARTTPAPAIPPAPAPVPEPVVRAPSPPPVPPQASNHTRPSVVAPQAAAPPQPRHRPSSQQIISPVSSDTPARAGSPAVRMAALDTGTIQRRKKSEYTLGSLDVGSDADFREWGGDGADDFDASEYLPKSRWKGPLTIVLLTLLVAVGGGVLAAKFYPGLLGDAAGTPDGVPGDGSGETEASTLEGSAATEGSAVDTETAEGSSTDFAEGSGVPEPTGENAAATAGGAADETPPEPPVAPVAEPVAEAAAPTEPVRLDFDGQMTRGERALERGDYDAALEAFGAASDISNRAEPHVGAAEAYERMGRSDLALLRYRRAIAANERYVPAWAGLAAVQERLGDSEALQTWQHVERIARDSRTRARALDAISRLAR